MGTDGVTSEVYVRRHATPSCFVPGTHHTENDRISLLAYGVEETVRHLFVEEVCRNRTKIISQTSITLEGVFEPTKRVSKNLIES